jgi:zinc D-Ala-D-Ala carboxypeptidase
MTPHFTLQELTASETASRNGWDNTPGHAEVENLNRLAELLEQARNLLGKPIMVSSGYRSKQVNDAVGSKDTSQHRLGCAADIKVSGMTPDQVCRAIKSSAIPYDQLIREFDAWTHISVPNTASTAPRRQALVIDRQGTRLYT